VVFFSQPAMQITQIPLASKGVSRGKTPQAPRYTIDARLDSAKTIEEVFGI